MQENIRKAAKAYADATLSHWEACARWAAGQITRGDLPPYVDAECRAYNEYVESVSLFGGQADMPGYLEGPADVYAGWQHLIRTASSDVLHIIRRRAVRLGDIALREYAKLSLPLERYDRVAPFFEGLP